MSNATPARLRDAVLSELCRAFEDGVTARDEDGEIVTLTPSAQYINSAVSFLRQFPPKDDLPSPEGTSETLKGYREKMPFKTKKE